MVKTKRRRIFFAVVTIAIAAAGTLLTLLNNIDIDSYSESLMLGLLTTGIAIALAACFTAMEACFIWAHKEVEDTRQTWRKAVLITTGIALIIIMGFAVYQELMITLAKISNRSLASNSAMIVKSVDRRNQRGVARDALKSLNTEKIKTDAMPFVVGYVAAGIAAFIIGATAPPKKERPRVQGGGNLLLTDPALAKLVQDKYKIDPTTARAYRDRNGGVAVWNDKSRQIGFLSKYDVK